MTEQAVTFGPGRALVGVLNRPAHAAPNSPIVLLTNAGVLPRQGPHRMNVRIARALAEKGIGSLRFDLAGHGDSQSIGNTSGVRAQAVLDLKSAMDWVQSDVGAHPFVMCGICSSSVNAYDVALADERILGLLMFDGFWYRSRWTIPVRHFKRATATGWQERLAAARRRLLRQPLRAVAGAPSAEEADSPLSAIDTFASPPLADFAAGMQRLTDRGTDVVLVYGGSLLEYYSYAGQFQSVFGRYPFASKVRAIYVPDIDHTFITRHAQARMVGLICEWMTHRSQVSRPA